MCACTHARTHSRYNVEEVGKIVWSFRQLSPPSFKILAWWALSFGLDLESFYETHSLPIPSICVWELLKESVSFNITNFTNPVFKGLFAVSSTYDFCNRNCIMFEYFERVRLLTPHRSYANFWHMNTREASLQLKKLWNRLFATLHLRIFKWILLYEGGKLYFDRFAFNSTTFSCLLLLVSRNILYVSRNIYVSVVMFREIYMFRE